MIINEKLSLLTELIKLAQCDHHLREQMNIDQESSDSELDFLKDIGIRLGLSSLATERVLSSMDQYPDKVIPPEKLIEIFKAYYN